MATRSFDPGNYSFYGSSVSGLTYRLGDASSPSQLERKDDEDEDECNREIDEGWMSRTVGADSRDAINAQIGLILKEDARGGLETSKTAMAMPIHEPVLAILNRACFDLTPDDRERVFVFIENSKPSSSFKDDPNPNSDYDFEAFVRAKRASDRPALVGFFVLRETAKKIITREINQEDSNWPTVPPSQGLISIVDCQIDARLDEDKQDRRCLRHLHVLSRHNVASSVHYGIVATRRYFRLTGLGIGGRLIWRRVLWTDPKCVEKLYEHVKRILDEAAKERPPAIPRLDSVIQMKDRKISMHSVTLRDTRFRLLQSCNGRKTFVAIGSTGNDPKDARIFKYSWYKENQRNRERVFLERLLGAPGIVQIDKELSQESVDTDDESGRKRNLLVLKTIGYPLCSCKSVGEFLEAMYDLLEVLRYLVQERRILHRDVSWGNVLLTPKAGFGSEIPSAKQETHSAKSREEGGLSESTESQIKSAEGRGVHHTYRFIHDILGEDKARVRIALADFDHAADLEDPAEDLRTATGTPMFMALDLIRPRNLNFARGLVEPKARIIQETVAVGYDRYSDPREKDVWDEFLSSGRLERPQWKVLTSDIEMSDSFRHGAMHDAESVFWIMLLFFCRMVPAGKNIPLEKLELLTEKRGMVFRRLTAKKVGDYGSCSFFANGLDCLSAPVDDEKVREIYASLDIINTYLLVPWYNVAETGRGERYEFHLHEFMQRLLWKHIIRLRDSGDSIPVDGKPLPVKIDVDYPGPVREYTTSCMNSFPHTQELTSEDSELERPNKRAKIEYNDSDAVMNETDGSVIMTDDDYSVIPVDKISELASMFRKYFFPEHWDIVWWKRRERRWYLFDKMYD